MDGFIFDHATFPSGISFEYSADLGVLKLPCCSSFECFSRKKESLTYRWICLDFKSLSSSQSSTFSCQINLEDFFCGQFSSCSKEIGVSPCPPLFTYLFNLFFFLHLLVNEGKLPLTDTLPSCGNGFPGPLLCQLLAAVVLQSKRCRNPFSGQCLWLRMLLPLYVCVCVLLRRRDRVWMRENELDLNACGEYLSCLFINASMLCFFLFNLNFKLLCPEKY